MLTQLWNLLNGTEQPAGPVLPAAGLMQVTTDATRCVQCGLCLYNCPVGIAVREYARRGQNVTDSRCISCGTCIEICPRGTLQWGPAILIGPNNELEVNRDAVPDVLQLLPRELP